MASPTFGLDAADAPKGAQGKQLLDALGGAFWGAYLGGPRLTAAARQSWTPGVVTDLAAQGVAAFAPIYVGLQNGDMAAHSADTIDAAGAQAAEEAAARMQAFGWGPGSLAFLDVEHYEPPATDLLQRYTYAWMARLRDLGYRAGVYGNPDTLSRYFGSASSHPSPDCLWIALYRYFGATASSTPLTRAMCQGADPAAIPRLAADAFSGVPRLWQFAGNVTLLNRLVDANVGNAILVGPPASAQKPAPLPADYRVKTGDTLSAIAKQRGLSLSILQAANPQIPDLNRIAVGQVIHLPTA